MVRMVEAPTQVHPLDPHAVRKDFPILERMIGDKPLVYLDNAATTQKPRQVIEAVVDHYEQHNANVHRAIHTLGEEATRAFEAARATIAGFIGSSDPHTVVFTRGTTEAINLVAHGWGRKFLHQGDVVLLTAMEHHSNIVPWQLCAKDTGAVVRAAPLTDEGRLDMDAFRASLNEQTKMIAVTGMSNVLGTVPPLEEIVAMARIIGAKVLVDGAQLVPHAGIDVEALDIDFLAFSGHKMLGPTASGGLYAKRELLEDMDPFMGGGEMIREVTFERSTWHDVPWKFEAGTMNIAQEIGLAAAIEYLQALGMDAVRAHEQDLTAYAIERLTDAGARVFGPQEVTDRGSAVSFAYGGIHPHDLATILDREGVAIRAGHHCAQPLMRILDVPATARASFYLYNTREEVDVLIDALGEAKRFFA